MFSDNLTCIFLVIILTEVSFGFLNFEESRYLLGNAVSLRFGSKCKYF